jgi:hypothetical protein
MLLNHIQQVGNQCGQTCLAMLCNIPVSRVIEIMGKKGATYTTDLVKFLRINRGRLLGLKCPDKLIRCKDGRLPRFCIVKACSPSRRRSHWMLMYDWRLYDPEGDPPVTLTGGWKITSYLPLTGHLS